MHHLQRLFGECCRQRRVCVCTCVRLHFLHSYGLALRDQAVFSICFSCQGCSHARQVRTWLSDDQKAEIVGEALREAEARIATRTEALVNSDGSLKAPSVSKVRAAPCRAVTCRDVTRRDVT